MRQDYRDYRRVGLSESSDGRGIKVTATASPGTDIHTALENMSENEWDEIHLYAMNTSGSDVKLTMQFGGTTSPDDEIEITIQAEAGLIEVVPGLVLQNSQVVKAYAATADVIVLHGYVNRYEYS